MTSSGHPNIPATPQAKEANMRDTDSTAGHLGRSWQSLGGRRRPLWLAALVAIAIAWTVVRRGSAPPERPAAAAEASSSADETGSSDSVVALDTTAERLAGIELITAGISKTGVLSANGTITYDGNHVSVVASRAEGRVVSVRTDLGQRVGRGDILVIVESPEVGETRGTYGRARAALEVARRNYEREKRLYDQSISSQKELLEAEGEYRSAEAELNAALAKLKALGASPEGQGGTFGLASPVSGTVVERHATPGQIAGPSTDLLTVADLRHVWITVDVYEADFTRVRNGVPARVIPTALRDTFPGKVTFAGGVVDSLTRTVKVRVEVENETRLLRPGMFAQVYIETPIPAGSDSSVVIPEIALQEVDGRQVVFVPAGEPGRYVAREVGLGPRASPGMVSLVKGLRPGDRVVGNGAFQLKAELIKETFAGED